MRSVPATCILFYWRLCILYITLHTAHSRTHDLPYTVVRVFALRSRTARLRRAAGEKQTLIHGGIALPVAKPTPRTAVRAPKARSKKKARAHDHFDEDDDGMDGMSGVGASDFF